MGNKGCKFDNDKDLELYSIRPGYSLDGTGAGSEYGRIDLDMSDEEAAAIEDAICDDEDADRTDVYGCMSDKRKQQMKNIEKVCDEVDGKMTKDGCVTDSDGPKADKFEEKMNEIAIEEREKEGSTNVIEDWRNEVKQVEEEP